jgi:hypothetical protein
MGNHDHPTSNRRSGDGLLPASNRKCGWFWQTREGKALLLSITPDLIDDADLGDQSEED